MLREQLKGENIPTKEVRSKLEHCKEVVVRISEVCLFLDINHCQKILKQPLLKRLNSLLFSALIANDSVLPSIAKTAFKDRDSANP